MLRNILSDQWSPAPPPIGDEITSGSMKIKAAPKIKMVDFKSIFSRLISVPKNAFLV